MLRREEMKEDKYIVSIPTFLAPTVSVRDVKERDARLAPTSFSCNQEEKGCYLRQTRALTAFFGGGEILQRAKGLSC